MSSALFGSSTVTPGGLHAVQTTAKPIRYHTTEIRRLLEVTLEGLSSNGIVSQGLGDATGGIYILSGGLRLTQHASNQLPQMAGGTGFGDISHMDRRTVSFLDQANAASPAGFKHSRRPSLVNADFEDEASYADESRGPAMSGHSAARTRVPERAYVARGQAQGGTIGDSWPSFRRNV
jgi:hypothetical protein